MDCWLNLKHECSECDDRSASCSEQNEVSSSHLEKLCHYSKEYLSNCFTFMGGEERPQCVFCYDILSNETTKPSKLRRHYTKYKEHDTMSIDFFHRLSLNDSHPHKFSPIKLLYLGLDYTRNVLIIYLCRLLSFTKHIIQLGKKKRELLEVTEARERTKQPRK